MFCSFECVGFNSTRTIGTNQTRGEKIPIVRTRLAVRVPTKILIVGARCARKNLCALPVHDIVLSLLGKKILIAGKSGAVLIGVNRSINGEPRSIAAWVMDPIYDYSRKIHTIMQPASGITKDSLAARGSVVFRDWRDAVY